jgi:hypothetical protein
MKNTALIWGALALATLTSLVTGCDDTVAQWDLDNDRIIAVRSSSPGLAAGERSTLDVLVTSEGRGPYVVSPQTAVAVASDLRDATGAALATVPDALARAVVADGAGWAVVAPSAAELAALRTEMKLAADAVVPLRIGVRVDLGSGPLDALKVVSLGASAANPTLGAVMINGAAAQDGMVLPADVDVTMSVEVAADDKVYWLSSIGALSDEEDPVAELNHDSSNEDHLTQGHLAVVVRARNGGVTWAFWTASIAP